MSSKKGLNYKLNLEREKRRKQRQVGQNVQNSSCSEVSNTPSQNEKAQNGFYVRCSPDQYELRSVLTKQYQDQPELIEPVLQALKNTYIAPNVPLPRFQNLGDIQRFFQMPRMTPEELIARIDKLEASGDFLSKPT